MLAYITFFRITVITICSRKQTHFVNRKYKRFKEGMIGYMAYAAPSVTPLLDKSVNHVFDIIQVVVSLKSIHIDSMTMLAWRKF